jgi:hypothetical protein
VRILDHALTQTPVAHNASPSLADRFVGRLANMQFVIDVVAFGETLVALSPDADDPMGSVTKLAIEDADMLRITASDGLGFTGGTIRYMRDDTGRVVKVVLGGVSAYPFDIYRVEHAATAIVDPFAAQ